MILLKHEACFACCPDNTEGLGLKFSHLPDGRTEALFTPLDKYQGYDGVLHGGIICTILDAAMTRLLLHKGISALTAKIEVRFHRPILISNRVVVRAKMVRQRGRFFEVASQARADGSVAATATGKFLMIDKSL